MREFAPNLFQRSLGRQSALVLSEWSHSYSTSIPWFLRERRRPRTIEGLEEMIDKLRSALRNPKTAVRHLALYLGKYTGNRGYRKFIVLARSRTGSNLLISILNSPWSIVARGEIFSRLNGRTPETSLANVFCRHPQYVKAVGFKIFYYHPQDDDSGRIWHLLQSMEDLCVIHLKRENILRTLVSRKIADRTNTWIQKETGETIALSERRVRFTKDELLEGFQQTRGWENQFDEAFRSKQLIQVTYEQLLAAPQENFRRLADALGVTSNASRVPLKKQNPESLSQLIENYQDLKGSFAGTEWATFFED